MTLTRATSVTTPVGRLSLIVRNSELIGAGFCSTPALARWCRLETPCAADFGDSTLEAIAHAVDAYFDGDLVALDALPVGRSGSPFATAVWDQLRHIPAGSPVSYSQLAAAVGRPGAARAVGHACASNRIALVVPCHRVLRIGGGAGGYLYGEAIKRSLLDHEAGRLRLWTAV